MSWTYSGDPASSAKDQVRFFIGDTNQKEQLLNDQEINYVLSLYGNVTLNAAIRCCEMIIGKYARLANETVGRVSIDYSQKAKGYREMMKTLQNRTVIEGSTPYAGGISVSDKIRQSANNDRVRPDFYRHMMENYDIAPWTTQTGFNLFILFGG